MTIKYEVAGITTIKLPFHHTSAELKHKLEIALVQYGWPELEVTEASGGRFIYQEKPDGKSQVEYYEVIKS